MSILQALMNRSAEIAVSAEERYIDWETAMALIGAADGHRLDDQKVSYSRLDDDKLRVYGVGDDGACGATFYAYANEQIRIQGADIHLIGDDVFDTRPDASFILTLSFDADLAKILDYAREWTLKH